MHIPQTETKYVGVESFYSALEAALEPQDYDSSRWLYVPPRYDEYRYILGTRGEKPLICVGINPSTAEPNDLDNTLKSVERIAHFNGYETSTLSARLIRMTSKASGINTCTSRIWRRSNTRCRSATSRPCGLRGGR